MTKEEMKALGFLAAGAAIVAVDVVVYCKKEALRKKLEADKIAAHKRFMAKVSALGAALNGQKDDIKFWDIVENNNL